MISDLFKSICHDAPKRVIKRHDVEEESRPCLTRYKAQQALSAEHEREREELDDIALFVRLVQRQRRG